MRFILILVAIIALAQTFTVEGLSQTTPPASQGASLAGRWRVKFTLSGVGEKNLIFDSQTKGSGSFMLLDTGPDNKPEPTPLPALWSSTVNNRVTLAGEVELPIGTCCRELGTLILKGKLNSGNSLSGKAIFITSTEDDENFNGFRSLLGSFTAVREPK